MRKLFVFDLDGTLLNSNCAINEENKKMINECKKAGNIITYITGRGTIKTNKFVEGLACDAYACNNGSKIFCEDKLIKSNCIDFECAQKFLQKECSDKKIFAVIEPYKYLNYEDKKIDNKYYFKCNIDELPQEEIDMISINDRNGIETTKYEEIFNVKKSGKSELMINSKNATKLTALKTIAEYFNVKKEDIISFGDDFSDIEIFENSEISVAMGNAINELKSIATYVIEDNDSDGIAKFIDDYLRNNITL